MAKVVWMARKVVVEARAWWEARVVPLARVIALEKALMGARVWEVAQKATAMVPT